MNPHCHRFQRTILTGTRVRGLIQNRTPPLIFARGFRTPPARQYCASQARQGSAPDKTLPVTQSGPKNNSTGRSIGDLLSLNGRVTVVTGT